MTVPDAVSPEPKIQRGTSMKLAPRNAAAAPTAVATEFIVTTCSRGTTSGSAALSPEVTNRLKPLTVNAAHSTNKPRAPAANRTATPMTNTRRAAFATINTNRRSHRSKRAPANGPSSE